MTVRCPPLFLAIFALILAAGCGGSDDLRVPDPTPFEPQVMDRVHEIRDLAAEVRELDPNEDISEGTLTREALTAFYEESEARAHEDESLEFEAFNIAFRLLHLIGPEDNLLELFYGMSSSQTAGLYFMEEDKLFLISQSGPELDFDAEITLAHEYVHSFQDAAFDFDRLNEMVEEEEEEEGNTEYSMTIQALMEGDATLSSLGYASKKLGYADFLDWFGAAGDDGTETEQTYPPAIERYSCFPYGYGLDFVLHLWTEGGWEEVNKAYADPPTTTEQILHPEKYLQGEEAQALVLADLTDALGDGWKEIDDSVFGEFDVYNYLMTALENQPGVSGRPPDNDALASRAAEGWRGGRIAIYAHDQEEDRALVHLVITWDTFDDATEFVGGYLGAVQYLCHGAYRFDEELGGDSYEVMWDRDGEHVYAWWDGYAFTMLAGTDRDDVVSALAALEPTAAEWLADDDIPRGACR